MDGSPETGDEPDVLRAEIAALRDQLAAARLENDRLKEELRRARRGQYEVPPHYL